MECGAKTRSGKPCKAPAMENGRCRIHGGKTPRGMDSPHWKHGNTSIYRDYLPDSIKSKVSALENINDPLDLTHELALCRALLADFLERFVAPLKMDAVSISIADSLIDRINKTVANMSKIKNDTALTGAEVVFLATTMVALLDRYVDDASKREAFKQEIFSLVLPADTVTIDQDG